MRRCSEAAKETERLKALLASREEELSSVRGNMDEHTASMSKELQSARDEAAKHAADLASTTREKESHAQQVTKL